MRMLLDRGFEWQQEDYLQPERRVWFDWELQALPSEENIEAYFRRGIDRLSVGLKTAAVLSPPSAIPLGRDLRFLNGSAYSAVYAVSEKALATVRMKTGYQRECGVAKPTSPLGDADFALQEAVARWLLATKTGQAYQSGKTNVAGREYNSRRDGTNIHIDAMTWSQNQGYAFRMNRDSGCAIINHPRGTITLALGAPSVKVGNEWRPIPDVVICDGERILLPKVIYRRALMILD